ncbi:MAG: asparagine synthase (glutamine-hydrolyzing) [Proteobacteria bacterium]|jgi:asparagine synthase (glutamine-hydrolysing)|nr:asparagine synthase (glutamine-hydrolyzing) [Pseudomonadota bacterium]
MCRIFGYISNNYKVDNEIIDKVKNSQLSGGPDEQTICRINDNALIANNRLSIQDILQGSQPFVINNIYVVFNGEIYNHQELKYNLSKIGYMFKTNTDGEVIGPLYLEYGLDFVKYLDGMFCIALYDNNTHKLILTTDSLAIKSVYYTKTNNIFCFSSDINGIYAFGKLETKYFSDIKIDNYLVGRSLWGNETFYDGVKVMTPNQVLVIDHDLNTESFNYQTNIVTNTINYNINDAGLNLHGLMEQEISSMLKSDVPACVVLSGGLDSSYIAALIKRQVDKLDTFHVCYDVNWQGDERKFAAELAQSIGANHYEVELNANDMVNLMSQMIDSIGLPNTAPHALAAYGLYKYIGEAGYKVAFAGEGSDEIFGGYTRFSQATFNQSEDWVNEYFNLFSINSLTNIRKYYSKEYLELVNNSKDTYYDLFCSTFKGIQSPENRLNKLLEFEQNLRFPNYILRRTDHLSMASSLEVRVPFCQSRVKSFANNLPIQFKLDLDNQKKVLFKAATGIVPISILQRKKQPFTLPVLNILKHDSKFKDFVFDNLANNLFLKKYFNIPLILHDINSELNSKQADIIWAILVLGLWMNQNLNNI